MQSLSLYSMAEVESSPAPSGRGKFVDPHWTLCLPLLALTAIFFAAPENRLIAAMASSTVYTLMQWLVPQCRLRRDAVLSPQNLATLLFLAKLVVVPMLVMLVGPTVGVLPSLPTHDSIEWALLIATVAYIAFCYGLSFVSARALDPGSRPLLNALSQIPSRNTVLVFAALGLTGFALIFGSPAGFMEYFLNPPEVKLNQSTEATWAEFLAIILRPFLAVALVAMWSRHVDGAAGHHSHAKKVAVGILAAVVILAANLTFAFNRAAFVFPLISMAAVYSARVKRISPWTMLLTAAMALPLLISIGTYRAATPRDTEVFTNSDALQASLAKASDNFQVYSAAPQFTGYFYEKTGWGDHLLGGSSLIASALSPIPILGKSFRETNGPAIFNRAIYGSLGFEDQIIPYEAELFVNFHAAGVAAGFFGLGLLLGGMQRWLDYASSTFGAFAIQYAGIWGATLTVWSVSIYSQILFYFFGPFYVFIALQWARKWLRSLNRQHTALRHAHGAGR
ncbi:MAG: hypothetical protein ABI811_18365 [Acidobacteriota bacterium]